MQTLFFCELAERSVYRPTGALAEREKSDQSLTDAGRSHGSDTLVVILLAYPAAREKSSFRSFLCSNADFRLDVTPKENT